MPSHICTTCSEGISRLLFASAEGLHNPVHRNDTILYPETCYLCANLQSSYSRNLYHFLPIEHISFGKETLPHQGHVLLTVMIDSEGPEVFARFLLIPAPVKVQKPLKATSDTLSQSALSFLNSKLIECRATHPRCQGRHDTDGHLKPVRLLQVRCRSRHRVQLVDTNEEQEFPYFTLSHCWGGLKPYSLTRETEHELRAGVSLQSLPKTFRQAIEICRQLGIDYLWIDSLCIYQDRLADWHAQAACMQSIYSGAICNIAATSAENSNVGLQFTRNPIATVPFQITVPVRNQVTSSEGSYGNQDAKYVLQHASAYADDVADGPLNKRAWVLQERLLSKRIMHFTSSGVYWECMTDICSDLYPIGLPETSVEDLDSSTQLKRTLFLEMSRSPPLSNRGWSEELFAPWTDVLSRYTWSELSYENDIFVALTGVGQKIAKATGDTFVCGLSRTYMLPQLLWYKDVNRTGPQFPDEWRAPSWSWASVLAPTERIKHIFCSCSKSMATVKDLNVDAKQSGLVRSATVTLRGNLVRAHFKPLHPGPKFSLYSMVCQASGDTRHDLGFVLLDNKGAETILEDVTCIALYEDTCGKGLLFQQTICLLFAEKNCVLGILLLQMCDDKPNLYRRIGVMFLEREHYDFYRSNESPDTHEITIV